jgi:hypothetical protein
MDRDELIAIIEKAAAENATKLDLGDKYIAEIPENITKTDKPPVLRPQFQ